MPDGFDIATFRSRLLTTDKLVRDIWDSKYRLKRPDGTSDEDEVTQTRRRVVEAVYKDDPDREAFQDALVATVNGYFIPAGRVNAGAGTGRAVTLINCFVLNTIPDSMPGIQRTIGRGAFTMQQGGGIGTDYSTVRPALALVKRTGSIASGVIQFMDEQNGMCNTVMSAGTRRGAMMGTLRDDHPDLWNADQFETYTDMATGDTILRRPSFISAKRQKGRLTGFNMSVLVSDRFKQAVADDVMWDLGFHCPKADGKHVAVYDKPFPYDEVHYDHEFQEVGPARFEKEHGRKLRRKGEMLPWYVYTRVNARRIWEDMTRNTYSYSEPGVIFIDRVNDYNNLNYCEEIRCTNPCGEQPLPPEGCCCLGSVNLAFMVVDPFTSRARFDFDLMRKTTKVGVRFLDNVLDVTEYPLKSQYLESQQKRRIGLGVTGFHDALLQLGVVYGSDASIDMATWMAKCLKEASYEASCDLAEERGSFPLFESDKFLRSKNLIDLPNETLHRISRTGLRNGVLNTIAPNGTISVYIGNVSSGHEPHFAYQANRKVRQPDGSTDEYVSLPYGAALFRSMFPDHPLPDYFVASHEVSVLDHVRVHAAWQKHIDASVSKTINCPREMDYEEFAKVYDWAYELGCKGCTTYRDDPISGRGSVLSVATEEPLANDKPDDLGYSTSWTQGGEPKADDSVGVFSEHIVYQTAVTLYATHYRNTEQQALSDLTKDEKSRELWIENAKAALKVAGESIALEVARHMADNPPPLPMAVEVMERPRILQGRTYKLKWPQTGDNWYITITHRGGVPFEVFITTKVAAHAEWVQALSILLTAVLRRGGDVKFLITELQGIHSASGGQYITEQRKFRHSQVAAIGGVIEEEFRVLGMFGTTEPEPEVQKAVPPGVTFGQIGEPGCCPECGARPLVHQEGCEKCQICSYTRC
jgi:ribonucleoside-diphosphate reductase alpha chain